ncbi:MAG: type I DNA topoisomerase [Clostridia bacterium]|nr:type I DNA topoisomerase [Clostridia bacterium]
MAANKQKLIIVESPAKARTISKFLGKGYKVEASQGHVRDLPKSQIGVDPEDDFALKYITIRGRGDILTRIRKEARNATQIFLATDPDREGEAISWHLAQVLGIDMEQPCRIEFHEVTKKAIQAALKNPRKLDMGRVDAQQARRVLDRLVGYKISPLLWTKIKKGLSAGRVQSVATRMVVMREADIEAFIPEEYWEVSTKMQAMIGRGRKVHFNTRLATLDGAKAVISNAADAEAAVERIRNAHFAVSSVKHGEKRKTPAAPFTTSSLQQEASRKLGFTTAKTMQVVQQLYEGVDLEGEGTQGIVTYIRTDSVRVSDDALAALREYIPERFGAEYLPEKPIEYRGRKNAQEAHEAIRPTDVHRTPEKIRASLTKEQFNLYRLIYNRFIASQMMPALYETMTMEITGNGVGLRFYGEHKKFPGFTSVYEEGTDEDVASSETTLPPLNEGDAALTEDVFSEQHFTQPPSRYTEASLVRALEEKGIGRPSTYAPTITTIISRGYVSREKKRLYPTELGRMVTSMMEEYFEHIVDTEFTAELEDQLDAVEEGTTMWKEIIRDFYPGFREALEAAEQQIEKVEIKDEPSDVPCDKCGAMMVYKMGRFGRFLACPNFPDCRNTRPILTYIEAPCPACGARLMEKTSKKNRKFYGCECYPECTFVSWEKPVTAVCPQCGGHMVEKRGRKGELWHLCANETCRCRVEVQQENTEDADE